MSDSCKHTGGGLPKCVLCVVIRLSFLDQAGSLRVDNAQYHINRAAITLPAHNISWHRMASQAKHGIALHHMASHGIPSQGNVLYYLQHHIAQHRANKCALMKHLSDSTILFPTCAAIQDTFTTSYLEEADHIAI